MKQTLEEILAQVEKPARYIGGEYNEAEPFDGRLNYCICFPDVYEVGMSNLGIKIVAEAIRGVKGAYVDRCFAPWPDFGEKIKENGIELYALGNKKPLKTFDMIGFSLQYEMSYTNVLYMLDLAGIPLRREDRGEDFPVIQAGGPCACNPEPMADFIDIFTIGDGEDNMRRLAELKIECKSKEEFLRRAAEEVEGVYVPALLNVVYGNDGKIKGFSPDKKIKKALCRDLDSAVYPKKFLVPNIEAVFDRAILEVMRGCYRGCRFCQAGFLYRPVRERSKENMVETAGSLICTSGFDEISLNSLSTGDYRYLRELIPAIKESLPGVHLALPSLRLDSFDGDFVQESRKSSLTFAPEAGTQRLRDVINKDVTEDEIMRGIRQAFEQGYTGIKLYFMLGLPTETDDDLKGIRDIVYKIRDVFSARPNRLRSLRISVSVSTFIPKPFTPFQWERQATREEVEAKIALLRKELPLKGVSFSWNDYALSEMEAVFARGDRRTGKVIEAAYKKGCIFDGWSNIFKTDEWYSAFKECGVKPSDYTREWGENEILPWDFIDVFIDKKFLLKERRLAYDGKVTGSCLSGCKGCGLHNVFCPKKDELSAKKGTSKRGEEDL
ncbi:MAG: TIGR03960 family B12-binding radical SAM protein [Clostridia bacterium]|nr:TIGR03960 family B12-binding radical SAM protein [Clostridia bacterium]